MISDVNSFTERVAVDLQGYDTTSDVAVLEVQSQEKSHSWSVTVWRLSIMFSVSILTFCNDVTFRLDLNPSG